MSIFHDSIGLPRAHSLPLTRRFNLGRLATNLDEMAAPARLLRLYFVQRAELRAARRALELSLRPKVQIYLHCKTPDGRACVDLVM